MHDILVPVSPGELLDKITILRIKAQRISDPAKLRNIASELDRLTSIWRESGCAGQPDSETGRALAAEERALEAINEKLWDIEDRIRERERAQRFDAEFIELARAVYLSNDERAAIKKRINVRLGSRIVEEKSYAPYRRSAYSAPQ
jgi:Family of unknown function (DUF6165)